MLNNLFLSQLLSATDGPSKIPYAAIQGVVIAFSVLMMLAAITMIIVVMMQKGTNDNVGVISGTSDTFYGKNKQRGKESLLKRITFGLFAFIIVCAVIVFVITQFK